MAEYGTFLYGAEQYGASAQTETAGITWMLLIDWVGVALVGTNEGNRLVDVKIQRGIRDYCNTGGRGLSDMRGGRAELTLDNYDRRYDPRCSTSDIYPYCEPGKTVTLDAVDNSTGTHYRVFTGRLADIRPISGAGGAQQVRFIVEDLMQVLLDSTCTENATIVHTNIREAIAHIIDDVLYPPYNLETDTQPVPVLDVANKNAGQAINDLAHAALGYFFTRVDGIPMYYARSHSGYTNHEIDQSVVDKQILVTQPWDHVYNHITAEIQRPYKEQTSVIYFLPYPEAISNGVDKTIYVSYAPTTDAQIDEWAANSAKDESGTDITDDVTISAQSLGIAYGYVTFTPAADGYITQLEIRGRPYKYVQEKSVFTDAASIAQYGIKKFTLDSPYLQDPHYAEVFSEVLKDFLKDDREAITFEIEQRPTTQFNIDIMNSITFTSATLDLDDTYYVTGIEHDWNIDTGQSVTSTFYVHKIVSDDTSITASEVEVQNEVPLGMGNPAGDPGTIGSYPGVGAPKYLFLQTWLCNKSNPTSAADYKYFISGGGAGTGLPFPAGSTSYNSSVHILVPFGVSQATMTCLYTGGPVYEGSSIYSRTDFYEYDPDDYVAGTDLGGGYEWVDLGQQYFDMGTIGVTPGYILEITLGRYPAFDSYVGNWYVFGIYVSFS